jgi:hypothetical protein
MAIHPDNQLGTPRWQAGEKHIPIIAVVADLFAGLLCYCG